MNKKEVLGIYLELYKLLEEDFMKLIKCVSLSGKNFAVFSPKLLSMFLLTCSEIDSILDEYVRQYNLQTDKNMNFCKKIQALCEREQGHLNAERVSIQISGVRDIVPFGKLSSAETTNWWHDYNLVKHNRMRKDDNGNWNYEKANLKNVLYAMAGLYIILHIFFQDELLGEDNSLISSRLFRKIN
ncbi:MAG: hypothetical protein K2M78_17695 [Lachnospiraceae bacterium]|nr:hypothetical protein [Lachnospiraceae bacterium]